MGISIQKHADLHTQFGVGLRTFQEYFSTYDFRSKNRIPLKSISLSGNPSTITCISNDFGYESLFSRQIQALGKKDDVLIVISTSGNSKNIIKAINQAKINKLKVISFLGNKGGRCKGKGYLDLIVNSHSTARIQESHIMIGHIICELVEKELKI